jgi:RNA polymerase sigma factor (TIGR02999 family)
LGLPTRARHAIRPHIAANLVRQMPTPDATSITDLLAAAKGGDVDARDAAARLVYAELHSIADGYLRRERADHTLQPTALVNEAYLRLLGQDAPWQNRTQFYGIAAQMMRRVLVDHARRTTAARRDRGVVVSLEDDAGSADVAAPDAAIDVLEVHDALAQLEVLDPRQAQIVELKFFAGFSLDEIAEMLGISAATVSREWAMTRAWLQTRLHDR